MVYSGHGTVLQQNNSQGSTFRSHFLCYLTKFQLDSPHSPLVPGGILSPRVGDVPVQLRVNNAPASSMVERVGGKDLGEVDRLRDTRLKGWLLRNKK